jgi:DNA repair photolyase
MTKKTATTETEPTIMSGKPVLWRPAKTVLTYTPEREAFHEKLLCDGLTLNLGDACVYSCSFCYVGSQIRKLTYGIVDDYNTRHNLNLSHEELVIRRKGLDGEKNKSAIQILEDQLAGNVSGFLSKSQLATLKEQELVVYSSTLVDVGANLTLLRETAEACKQILDNTNWQIRLLSKGHLLPKLVKDGLIPDDTLPGSKWSHHQRLIFGFSTGTLNDQLAKGFERGTALVSKRIESLHWLQDHGYRTFGMICPSLPQSDYPAFSKAMAEALRVEHSCMEHVWAEVLNVRGSSFVRTRDALREAGFEDEAQMLASVSEGEGYQQAWEAYARKTFEGHVNHIGKKLRFLQYVDKRNIDYWQTRREEGAVLLGKPAQKAGLVSVERSAPLEYYLNTPQLTVPIKPESETQPKAELLEQGTMTASTPELPLTAGQKAALTKKRNREAATHAADKTQLIRCELPKEAQEIQKRLRHLMHVRGVVAVSIFQDGQSVQSTSSFHPNPEGITLLNHSSGTYLVQSESKPTTENVEVMRRLLGEG